MAASRRHIGRQSARCEEQRDRLERCSGSISSATALCRPPMKATLWYSALLSWRTRSGRRAVRRGVLAGCRRPSTAAPASAATGLSAAGGLQMRRRWSGVIWPIAIIVGLGAGIWDKFVLGRGWIPAMTLMVLFL